MHEILKKRRFLVYLIFCIISIQGTGIDWQACPAGTYGSNTRLVNETECSLCDGGKYCGTTSLTAPSGDCTAG